MRPQYICSLPNEALDLVFDIYFDTLMNDYEVRTIHGAVIFRAESEALARYGIRTYHKFDWCGSRLTESQF